VKIVSCRFERAAHRAEDEPGAPGPCIVFLGRSNVGKSSLINRLLGVANLARTSSTPGRTQSVNFYRINDAIWFVDLPGYGFAKVPEDVRRSWGPMAQGFLERRRESIAMAVLVVDARHAPTDLDLMMRDWLAAKGIPFLAAATKADKLSGNGRQAAERGLAESLPPTPAGGGPHLVSAKTGLGIRGIWTHLDRALEAAPPAKGKGRAWTSEN
jgi:GTP-binding protein